MNFRDHFCPLCTDAHPLFQNEYRGKNATKVICLGPRTSRLRKPLKETNSADLFCQRGLVFFFRAYQNNHPQQTPSTRGVITRYSLSCQRRRGCRKSTRSKASESGRAILRSVIMRDNFGKMDFLRRVKPDANLVARARPRVMSWFSPSPCKQNAIVMSSRHFWMHNICIPDGSKSTEWQV